MRKVQCLFEKVNQIYLPVKKLSRYQNSKIFLSLNFIALSNLYMYIRSLQVWHGLKSFFLLQNCFYIKLLIIMFIRICDLQYWKINNICNTWKIKKKLKNLMTCDDCLSLTLHKKLSNLPENVSLPRIDKKKLHTQGFQLKGISRNMRCKLLQKKVYWKNRCIFQIFL